MENVISFIDTELIRDTGSCISSKDLYARYRQWHSNMVPTGSSDISDVKLAEEFGKHLSNKRLSTGRVWLDHKLVTWTKPVNCAEHIVYISLKVGNNRICTRYLSPVFKDLTLYIDDDVQSKMSLHHAAAVFNIENGKTLFPELWLINTRYTDLSINIVVDKPCIMKCTLTKCSDKIPTDGIYSNSITTGTTSVTFRTQNGQSSLWVASAGAPVTSDEFTKVTINGVTGLSCSQGDTSSLFLKCVSMNAEFVQSTNTKRSDARLAYIERDDTGYRYCLQFLLCRDCDVVSNFKLSYLPIPEDQLDVTINNQTYNNEYVLLCPFNSEVLLTYKTKYSVSNLPKHHILQDCELTATTAVCSESITRRLRLHRPGIVSSEEYLDILCNFASA